VLIGADGLVKQVRVINALPGWLTEESLRVAYEMKFSPAMKDGVPVTFWTPVDVSFAVQ
jgi:hypothetical protein